MSDLIYALFKYLTGVPVNVWFYLLLVAAPALVFIVGPNGSYGQRLGRLLLAIGCTYVLLNVALGTYHEQTWEAYEECQHQFPDGWVQHHKECGTLNIADGASTVFYLFLGWIPAASYVGFWELLWRIYYGKTLDTLGNEYRGKWFSYTVIGFFVAWMFFLLYINISIFQHLSLIKAT